MHCPLSCCLRVCNAYCPVVQGCAMPTVLLFKGVHCLLSCCSRVCIVYCPVVQGCALDVTYFPSHCEDYPWMLQGLCEKSSWYLSLCVLNLRKHLLNFLVACHVSASSLLVPANPPTSLHRSLPDVQGVVPFPHPLSMFQLVCL